MDEDVRWMAQLLEASLQSSGLSEREIEESLAWEPGADMVQELIERFRGLGYGQPAEAVSTSAALPSAGEIERTVDDALERSFGNFGKGRRRGG